MKGFLGGRLLQVPLGVLGANDLFSRFGSVKNPGKSSRNATGYFPKIKMNMISRNVGAQKYK
jgi:hypothetical protein